MHDDDRPVPAFHSCPGPDRPAIARRRQRQEEAAIAAALARQEGMFDGLLAELRAADPREEPCTAGTAPADDRIALRRAA
ncbi:hypothetical protein [Rubellimicrobium thermophilum]|nr:hypothetical protein [Rubellimicrobium thermophilum]